MPDITFAHPSLLHALWLLPVLLLLRGLAGMAAVHAQQLLVAKRLQRLLVASGSALLSWSVFVMQLLALALLIVTLAQPRWGEDKRIVKEGGKNVILAVDTSKSMLATDIAPNRLTRAKLAAQDLVDQLKEHRVGLIAFAGRAYLQAPLTTDHSAVVESLQALDTFTIPKGGTTISEALKEALDTFEKAKARSNGLILFSDGGDADAELESLLKKAREQHVVIVTIGVGTTLGGLVPDPDPMRQGDFIRDPDTGTPVNSRLEEGTLQKIASSTDGTYLRLGAQSMAGGVVLQALASLQREETGSREEKKPIERFYWPLSLAILWLMLSLLLRSVTRPPRRVMAGIAMILIGCASPLQAAVLSKQEMMDNARKAYESEDYSRARDLYSQLAADSNDKPGEDRFAYGLGATCHKLKDYDRAVDNFSRALRSSDRTLQFSAHGGLGNALYEQGAKAVQQQPDYTLKAWTDSVSHYESALQLRDDKALRENLAFVKQQLEQLKKQQEEKQQQQQKQKDSKSDSKDSKDQEEEEGDSKQGQKGDKPNEQKSKDGQQSEEKDGQKQEGDKPGEEQKDGKQGKGEEMQSKPGQAIPEGQIKAGEAGAEGQEKKDGEMMQLEAEDQKQDDRTGFSKNEARALLRTYNDQMQLQFQQRRAETRVKRDW